MNMTTIYKHYILSNYLKSSQTFSIYREFFSNNSLNHTYEPIEIPLTENLVSKTEIIKLESFIDTFTKDSTDMSIVVSNPYKTIIPKYCDQLSDNANKMKAVNLILKRKGKLIGENTDGDAFWLGQQHAKRVDYTKKTILILGCGGVSTSVSFKLAEMGVHTIFLYDTDHSKATALADKLKREHLQLVVTPLKLLTQDIIFNADVIYNGTGVGKESNNLVSIYKSPLPVGMKVRKDALAIDANYTPWETQFLRQCRSCGCDTLNGFSHMIAFTSIHLSKVLGTKVSYDSIYKIGK